MLQYEASIYKKFVDSPGIPKVYWTGVEGEYTVMVMDLLGPSLMQLFEFCNKKFEDKTVFWIGMQML